MFPALGTLMAALDKKIMKRDDDLKTVNASNQENARQVSRASVFLGKVAEAQLRTNELLEKIIQAASSPPVSAPTPAPGSGQGPNVEIDLDRRRAPAAASGSRSSVPQTGQTRVAAPAPRSMPTGALVAGGLAVAGVAAAVASRQTTTGGSEQGGAPDATQNNTPPATPQSQRRDQQSYISFNGEEIRYAIVGGRFYIGGKEVNEATYDEFRSLANQSTFNMSDGALSRRELSIRGLYAEIQAGRRGPSATATQQTGAQQGATGAGTTPAAQTPAARTGGGSATPVVEREQAESLASRVLHLKAKDIIFKADNYEFDQPSGGSAVPFTPAMGGAAPAAAASTSSGSVVVSSSSSSTTTTGPAQNTGIQSVVQKITQEFPNINVTSVLRAGSGTSQHAAGNAADLSLRGLSQDQRASLLQNIVSGKYGNIGGLGTYNATGDLLHVDTRTGPKMAWGPNRSRTSINETPQWFQAAVTPWMGGAGGTATASQEQEPRPGGEQMATPAAPSPSSGAQIAQASVQSEVATMQSQQVTSPTNESPEQPVGPTGSMEQIATSIDPNEPGPVEPPDAAQRYARLFNLAA
jgi:hypothetical protein